MMLLALDWMAKGRTNHHNSELDARYRFWLVFV